MNTVRWLLGVSLLGGSLLFGFGSLLLYADEGGSNSLRKLGSTKASALYKEECGACHVAYPASLLPEKSWVKLMKGLESHFDENAELDQETSQSISAYLSRYAAGKKGKRSSKMLRNFPKGKTPIRITKLPYFIRKHDEIPSRMVKKNPKVGSFSKCDACHKNAVVGNFNEHQVKIPGFGRWE